MTAPAEFYHLGGGLEPGAPSYIERNADTQLYEALQRGEFCYILTTRQMGKTSLRNRVARRLQNEGARILSLDLTALGQNLTPEQWYSGLLYHVGVRADLEEELEAFWESRGQLGPALRFIAALTEVVLKSSSAPMVVFIDEIDAVLSLPFKADELFAAIRELYQRRAEAPDLNRLTFCLIGVASPTDLIQDTRMTPFNIGTRIELNDFTPEEALPLAQGVNQGAQGRKLLERVLYWTGGHPYLTQRLCAAVAGEAAQDQPAKIENGDVDRLCMKLFLTGGGRETEDNLKFVSNRLLKSEADVSSLLDLYSQVYRGKPVADEETNPLLDVLKLSGVVRVVRGALKVRNRIYACAFDKEWIARHLPDAEVKRQKAAYRRGLVRATAIAGIVITLIAGLAAFGFYQANRANQLKILSDQRAEAAEHSAYIANMNAIQNKWENNNVGGVLDLLEATRNSKYRGWEWDYWNRLCHLDLLTITGHKDHVTSVAYSPDGKRLVTGSDDHTAKVWDAQTGENLLTLEGHIDFVLSVAFSPDGKRIVTGSRDNTARIWDAQDGQNLLTLRGHKSSINSVAYSSNGKRIVTTSLDHTAKIWNAQTGKTILTMAGQPGERKAAVFSPDNRQVVIAENNDDNALRIRDAENGEILHVLRGHQFMVMSVAYSPDGKRIVSSGIDNKIKVWEARTGKNLLTFQGHKEWIRSVAFSPDGKRIATGSQDNMATIWDARTGRELFTLKGHTGWVLSVAYSPDGTQIITGSNDKTAKVWDAQNGSEVMTLMGGREAVYSPDGRWILTYGDPNAAKIWDAQRGRKVFALKHEGYVYCADFSPDGKRILTLIFEGPIQVWDAQTKKVEVKFEVRSPEFPLVHAAIFSPDGKRIVTGGFQKARVWEARTGKKLLVLEGHQDFIYSVAFSPDGTRIATGSVDKTARVWDAQTGRELRRLEGHTEPIDFVTFSSDGKRLLTGGRDNLAKVWDIETGNDSRTLKGHSNTVTSVFFSPDGRRIVTGSSDSTAKVWEAASGKELLTLKGHKEAINTASFSPDGRNIVTGSKDNSVKIWFADDKNAGEP